MTPALQPSGKLEQVMAQIDPKQMKELIANLQAIQLTEGCSLGCDFCGLEAKKGVSDYIRFSTLERLFGMISEQKTGQNPILYYASDPFDYDFEGKNYFDAHRLAEKTAGYTPHTMTALPKGKEEMIIKHLLEGNGSENNILSISGDKRTIYRLSISPMNHRRISRVIKDMIPELDSQSTADVVFAPPKNGPDTPHFINQEILLKDLCVTNNEQSKQRYRFVAAKSFDFLEVNQKEIQKAYFVTFSNSKEKVIVYSIGKQVEPLDLLMGFSNTAQIIFYDVPGIHSKHNLTKVGEKNIDKLEREGIGCFDGTLITPEGIYTVETVRPTRLHPTGQIIKPFDGRIVRQRAFKSTDTLPYARDEPFDIQWKTRVNDADPYLIRHQIIEEAMTLQFLDIGRKASDMIDALSGYVKSRSRK